MASRSLAARKLRAEASRNREVMPSRRFRANYREVGPKGAVAVSFVETGLTDRITVVSQMVITDDQVHRPVEVEVKGTTGTRSAEALSSTRFTSVRGIKVNRVNRSRKVPAGPSPR